MKNIEDYLPFYLGCEVQTPKGVEKLAFIGILGSEEQRVGTIEMFQSHTNSYKFSEIKLILRPLDQMLDEEKVLFSKEVYDPDKVYIEEGQDITNKWEEIYDTVLNNCIGTPEAWRWLLKHGFDLFGLIEEGLAIDRTTV